MTAAEKLRLARQLDRLGVDIIEAGFPIASDGDFEAVRTIAAAVRRPIIAGLARAITADIDRAWAGAVERRPAAHPRLPRHLRHPPRAQAPHHARPVPRAGRRRRSHARAYCDDVEFSAEDATRSDLRLPVRGGRGRRRGRRDDDQPARHGRLRAAADIERMFTTVGARDRQPRVLSAHCHNDLGLAVANSLAAVQAGARQVECTINGIGERAGNASLEEIVMALTCAPRCRPSHRHPHAERSCRRAHAARAIVGVPVPPNKAIVGANAFAHEAGIHQDGVLKNPLTYEIMRPESVGAPARGWCSASTRACAASMRAAARSAIACAARARAPLRQGHGARRSHQDRRRRAADRHHSRSRGRRWRSAREELERGDAACH